MIVTAVTVYVKPEHVDDFIAATWANHEGSIKEPGNMRFDVLQGIKDPTQFLLYEAYESDEAAGEHKNTAHYKKWRDTVEPWMARPRQGVSHHVISPRERGMW
ncbi:MAG: antibiotic biosynthesis monooxygenase [Nitrospirae bacterium]|nr:antibiotic biosynthesis monooxygenase [Nitrospirota bacterium]MBF0592618.1 antibiotic biosynthesis monooxygenase [Nitrospirota bacterium]